MNKIYVLDTSTIAYHPYCFKSFKKSTVVIPVPVLEELDKLKKNADEAGKNARTFVRTIDKLIKDSKQQIHTGIKIEDGITIKIDTNIVNNDTLGSPLYGDNRILSYCIQLAQSNTNIKVILVSKDIGLRVRANSYGICAEDFVKDTQTINNRPNEHIRIELLDDEINEFYKNNLIDLPDNLVRDLNLKANKSVVFTDSENNEVALGRYNADRKCVKALNKIKNVFGLSPKNLEQQFAIDLLLDNDVKLVTLYGPSGGGKTLVAIAAGLHNIMERTDKKYEKMIIMKPVTTVGKDIGYLPGSREEKLAPFISSYFDSINFLMKNSNKGKNKSNAPDPYLSLMLENGTIEIEAIAYLRGRSLPNAFIILDEAQNASMHELKTILTRVGEGSKIVLIGDVSQIDNMSLSADNNALSTAISKFADYQIAGSVLLSKGERSALATLAAEIL